MEPERFLNKIIDPFSKPTQSLTASRVRKNEYLVAIVAVDPAENEPSKDRQEQVHGEFGWDRQDRRPGHLPVIFTDFYRSLEGSFSAGSTPIFASKYSFCSIFRDLQNYLAKFSKVER